MYLCIVILYGENGLVPRPAPSQLHKLQFTPQKQLRVELILGAAPLARGRCALNPSTTTIRTLSSTTALRDDDATQPTATIPIRKVLSSKRNPSTTAIPTLSSTAALRDGDATKPTVTTPTRNMSSKKLFSEDQKLLQHQISCLENDVAQLRQTNEQLRKERGAMRKAVKDMKKLTKQTTASPVQNEFEMLELYEKIAREARQFKPGTPKSVTLLEEKKQLIVALVQPDGTVKHLPMHLHWLRDTCKCPHCVNPDSGQKSFSTTSLPRDIKVQSAELNPDGSITIVWENDTVSTNDTPEATTHTSTYNSDDILEWQLPANLAGNILPVERTLWNRSKLQEHIESGDLRVSYDDWLNSEEGFWKAFESLARFGILFVHSIPSDRALVEKQVEKIANRIGILMHTFYGFTWDVRSKPRAENVAYTNVFLGLHQDLMYIDPPPRLQLLHCIANSFEGGESLFSDGARAAYSLEARHILAASILRHSSAPQFHYHRNGNDYHMARNTFRYTGRVGHSKGFLSRIHWAPPFQAPFSRQLGEATTNVLDRRVSPQGGGGAYAQEENRVVEEPEKQSITQWLKAAQEFEKEISAEENMFELKMKEGECVIFDNWRIMHGRREFKTEGQAEGAERWLKGTYISHQVYKAMEDKLQWRLAKQEGGVPLALGVAEAHGLGYRERKQLQPQEEEVEGAPKVEDIVGPVRLEPAPVDSEGPSRQPDEQLGTVNWNA
ncbi:taurine catabolism dioxygenase TauD, TfdA family-domain-containing protein [Sordaria brevicollis]|uniref:Taurine catabolism dioxygenase TauD, TfdA family-domain-containing protein n=1 Tax=Sordaria brevicollis TaxID=83679 RepID=A0AAE0NVX0_SORBR|nr:taurine catabolism dioxygenase TauD, TfdA family-domain-containing protein [Sordaria brevicollis]